MIDLIVGKLCGDLDKLRAEVGFRPPTAGPPPFPSVVEFKPYPLIAVE